MQFRIDYSVPSIKREFATILFEGRSVNLMVAESGFARVRQPGKEGQSPELEELIAAERTAQEFKVGVWTEEAGSVEASIRRIDVSI